MADRAPFTNEELDIISEMLLAKMLKRLAKTVQPVAPEAENDKKRDTEPTLDDYAALRARRRRQGRR